MSNIKVCFDTNYCWKLKIYCWKHCNKIIFKGVDSVVRPNFKVIFAIFHTCRSCEQCTGLRKNVNTCCICYPNSHKGCVWQKLFLPIYFTIQLIFVIINGSTALFSTIYRFYSTISTNFYLYLLYFQQKVLSFSSNISGSTHALD